MSEPKDYSARVLLAESITRICTPEGEKLLGHIAKKPIMNEPKSIEQAQAESLEHIKVISKRVDEMQAENLQLMAHVVSLRVVIAHLFAQFMPALDHDGQEATIKQLMKTPLGSGPVGTFDFNEFRRGG